MKRILIIEDDETIAAIERDYLVLSEFEVDIASTGNEGIAKGRSGRYDLILLDLMLPGIDGFTVCRTLRETLDIPILMVTARQEDIDKIKGLGIGADDYISKPFNPLELMARVKSQIRRYVSLGSMEKKDSLIVTGGLALDLDSKEITLDGEKVKLTATEYGILEYLMKNIGRVLSTNQIYEAVWKEPSFQTEKTVTVHIRRIREKIEINPKEPKYLKVVWGIGYKIEKL